MSAKPSERPLVSCLLPTYNRRAFIAQAIAYFQRQDYVPKELIILDDGTDDIGDLVPDDARLRYFRLPEKITLGAKLNLACGYARGPIIAHWDDDDWYAPWRLTYQVETLIRAGKDLCGINDLFYYNLGTGEAYRYRYPAEQRVWLSGSSLCYRKSLWEAQPFADINVGMDGLFVWATPPERLQALPDSSFSVLFIHAANVSPKVTNGSWWRPYPVPEIQRLVGSDWAFYQALSGAIKAETPVSSPISENSARNPVFSVKNVFACLVHESEACVIDLVRNLRYQDPDSVILLYNGGEDPRLLQNQALLGHLGAVVHPSPRPMKWGRLHEFALDCMKFCVDNFALDTFTIVDSDQLAIRAHYSRYLGQYLAGKSGLGLLSSSPGTQLATTRVAPAAQAWKEIELWRPFLKRFPQGEDKFVSWTFWPATVFIAAAIPELLRLFRDDASLQQLMRHSQIWATEEIVLPTLIALLGYEIAANPCSYDYVKYQVAYSLAHLEAAFARPEAYWVHPIPRIYGHPLRKHIRDRYQHYTRPGGGAWVGAAPDLRLTVPILRAMRQVEGWLEEDEADLLIAVCRRALEEMPASPAVVELGSFCGRATVVLASVAQAVGPQARVYAIDPHAGKIGALDQGLQEVPPTLPRLERNLARAGVRGQVEIITQHPCEVLWERPIGLLLVDGLHDYFNVARDFFHFEPWLAPGSYIAFHDYADYYPGVKALVDEILVSGRYRKIHCARSLMVIQKEAAAPARRLQTEIPHPDLRGWRAEAVETPRGVPGS
jgi:hypothetical protein